MSKIKILDETTINKISAGEVVDRPSSIVKELIENAIDANSTQITIEIKNGGIKYIRVTDNGDGIPPDDVEIAFYRHATSKIQNYQDINNIYTMGFRGEALSSIAAISKLNLYTKTQDDILGTHVEYIGGKLILKENIGCPSGTTLIVEDVFYNTPARYKFLKSESVETKHLIEVASREALINANISFELISNGKMIFKTSGKGSIEDNIYDILGYQLKGHLIPISINKEDILIKGFVSDLDFYEKNSGDILFYVNNRYVFDNDYKKTITESYKSLLTRHQYPVAVFNVLLPANRVDINVHPSKLYVKLYDKDLIFNAIEQEIKKKLVKERSKTIDIAIDIQERENTFNKVEAKANNIIYERPSFDQYELNLNDSRSIDTTINDNPYNDLKKANNSNESDVYSNLPIIKYKKIGQLFNTYILLEYRNDLYIIDQHAAHERILYEKYRNEYFNKNINTQILLIPEVIQLKHEDYKFVENIVDNFNRLGFEIDIFSDNIIILRALPAILGLSDVNKDIILDLIEEIKNGNLILSEVESLDNAIIKAACKSAVKANKRLDNIEIDSLINDLMHCKEPFTCPHGRPTILKKSIKDIEKLFKRI